MKVAGTLSAAALLALLAISPAALATGTAHAAAAKPRALAPPSVKLPYEARMVSCTRSPKTDLRTAVVGASMRPIADGTRLALKVDLYQRPLAGGRWTLRADVPGLGAWSQPSDPSIGTRSNDVYKYRQAVGRLVVPYSYRFRVAFRWSDASGRVVREETATTGLCREPDLRPDLVITSATVEPGVTERTAIYTVAVRNIGRSAAVNIGISSATSGIRAIRRLGPLESTEMVFVGPPCTAELPPQTFTVDPSNLIDEARETNNSLVASCPATLDRP
ncbi:CARDB domain-containing protein [Conexibacter stalactiti]|uniref:CARDB domain-containing protein n=1 Tax=Conexibacter stalactiti TaxID=1940611 RepID=A0ABU4HTL3_9ACTN|nr:CARDB domain-containing protein [Conexibacter stalactiti]MDW5596646.1 CARDB domain-containing protein [Conexibacter stalactiti]MEC5037288.1 CARDB domain-containing protein [Conexibacter stalactiti]